LGKKYEVRPYRTGDDEEIVKVLKLGFKGWPHFDLSCSSLEHWRWKYLDNPVGEPLVTVIALGDMVIGVRHSIPQNIKIVDGIYPCTCSGDMVVHPEFRGQGLSTKMWKYNMEFRKKFGFTLSYWVTSNPVMIGSYKGRRPDFPHQIVNLVRIRDIDLQLRAMPLQNAWFMKLGYRTVKLLNDVRRNFNGSKVKSSGLNISRVRSFDSRIDEFSKCITGHHDYIVLRSMEYLNWRYCDPRAGDFVVKLAEEDGLIKGYSVLRINRYREDYPVGFVVDLITLPNRLDVADSLVVDAIKYFDMEDINIINYQVVKNHHNERIFKNNGFLDSRIKLHIFCHPIGVTEEFNELTESPSSKICYSYGDIDSLPVEMPNYR